MVAISTWVPTFAKRGIGLDRVSGLPWGLRKGAWPSCGVCSVPLAFIGQLAHAPGRIDLGREGRLLYAFLCKNLDTMLECGLSAGVPGNTDRAHAIVTVDDAEPTESEPPDGLLDHAPALVVTEWSMRQEDVPDAALEPLLYGLNQQRSDWPEVWKTHEIPPLRGTKIGGIPAWVQDPIMNDMLPDPHHFRYVAQWSDQERVGKSKAWTTLEVGRLFLLAHGDDGLDFELYHMAR